MDKKSLISIYQNARLSEWIGDYDESEKLYEQIKSSDDSFSNILIPPITPPVREDAFSSNKKIIHIYSKYIEDHSINRSIDNFQKLIEDKNNFISPSKELIPYDPKKRNVDKKLSTVTQNTSLISMWDVQQYDIVKWKYSLFFVSESDDELKFELRGYNPDNSSPDLKFCFETKSKYWNVKFKEYKLLTESTDSFWFTAESYNNDSCMYVSIDRWGLLTGTILISAVTIKETLFNLHQLLSEVSAKIWPDFKL